VGVIHTTKEAALKAELERALGKVGSSAEGASLFPGITQKLIENRDTIMAILEQFGPVIRALAA
jgi:hypothetical protein